MLFSITGSIMIVGNVPAFDEIWIIGERTFLHTAIKYLKPMINVDRQVTPPYLTSRYDVHWDINYKDDGFWAQIRNSFVTLLNNRWKLPNYVIVIFSNHCVNSTVHMAHHLHIPMDDLADFINRKFYKERQTYQPNA